MAALGAGSYAIAGDTNEASEDAAELAALSDARLSLVEAVGIAEAKSGATAAEAEFEVEDGSAVFEIGLYAADGAELEATVDAMTGKVLELGADDEDNEIDGSDAD